MYIIYIYHTHANTHWHTCLTFYDRAQNNCLKPGQSSRHCLLSDRRAAELLAAYACIAIPLIFWCCKISWHLFTFGYSSTVDVDTLGESSCRYAHAYTLTRMETDGKAWSRCSHLKLHKDAMAGLWTVWRWQEIHRVLKILHRVNLPWTPMFESLIHNKTRTASTKKGNMSDMVSGKLLTCTEREIEITCVSFQFLSCSACLCPGSPTMCCRLHKSRLRDEAQASIVDHDGSTMDQQINLHEEKPWKTMKNLQDGAPQLWFLVNHDKIAMNYSDI